MNNFSYKYITGIWHVKFEKQEFAIINFRKKNEHVKKSCIFAA
jgi:hypothetical protein